MVQYVSLDRVWSVPDCPDPKGWTDYCPLGGQQFLNVLWQQCAITRVNDTLLAGTGYHCR